MLELYQAKDDIQTELASILQIISSLEFALSTETDPNTLIDKDKLSGQEINDLTIMSSCGIIENTKIKNGSEIGFI